MARKAGGRGTPSNHTAEHTDAAGPAPRANPLLLGQSDAEATVLRTWASGRMSHAWLLTGPKGVGKATLAYRMARFILAHGLNRAVTPPPDDPGLFGATAPPVPPPSGLTMEPDTLLFQRIAAGGHGDLRVVERGFADDRQAQRDLEAGRTPRRRTEIVVDDVREVGHFLSLTPGEGGWRVVIIDAADDMNRNAANAVLKVLEEPPQQAVLLLVAHNPARLPATIPSRCRRLVLRPLPDPILLDLLGRYRPDLDDDQKATLIALARGSIGTALSLARQGGLDLYADLTALLRDLPRLDVARLHSLGDKVARDDVAWSLVRDLLPGWLARLTRTLALQSTASGSSQEGREAVTSRETEAMVRVGRAAPLDRWVAVWEKTSHLLSRAEAVHLDRKQAVLAAVLLIERTASRAG